MTSEADRDRNCWRAFNWPRADAFLHDLAMNGYPEIADEIRKRRERFMDSIQGMPPRRI